MRTFKLHRRALTAGVLVLVLLLLLYDYSYQSNHSLGERYLHFVQCTQKTSRFQGNGRYIHDDKFNHSPVIDPKLHMNLNSDDRGIPDGQTPNKDPKLYKTILWYNPPWWIFNRHPDGDGDLSYCEYKNCHVSFDKKDFINSKAVIYSSGDGPKIDSKPPVPLNKRDPNQAWIFFTHESPLLTGYPSQHWDCAFNWTWNYRPDSDIYNPYGWLHRRPIPPNRNYTDIFKQKTGQVAWVVSNCDSPGKRDDYVRILKKYIPVDIYGKCGGEKKKATKNISEILGQKYKFYFGFENAFCSHYFTEKFFRYYKADMINVVRGKTKYQDYLPAESYIDTANFTSISELGKFMRALSEDEEAYIRYLKLKDQYEVSDISTVYKDALCNVCEKLNNLEHNRNTYRNIGEWLGRCESPTDLNEF